MSNRIMPTDGQWLAWNEVEDICDAAIILGLDRNAALAGIPQLMIATLPAATNPGAQILSDLHTLNAIETLANGDLPLLLWLKNAHRIHKPFAKSQGFAHTIRRLETVLRGTQTSKQDHVPQEAAPLRIPTSDAPRRRG